MSIPTNPQLPANTGAIPSTLGTIPERIESPESQPYLISFKRYNPHECELEGGAMNPYALDALKTIKRIGMQIPSSDASGTKVFGATTERVHNEHEYSRLFKGLDDPEIDMREVKLDGKERRIKFVKGKPKEILEPVRMGRLFFYEVGQTLFIVAIRATHYETKKR